MGMLEDDLSQFPPNYEERPRKVHLFRDWNGATYQSMGKMRRYANTLCKKNSDVPASHVTTEPEEVTCKNCLRKMGRFRSKPKDDTIRIVRVLEYVGPRKVLERALEQNAVKGQRRFGDIVIREAMLGDFPEVI